MSSNANAGAGNGRIVLGTHGLDAVFSELYAAYPLKLLSPRITRERVAVVYFLTYGGGLVGGDRVDVIVDVRDGAILVMLSQVKGSTKVFKTRSSQHRSVRSQYAAYNEITTQKMNVVVSPKSAFFLLPDPVTCFRSAKYNQLQTFCLSGDASAVLLDWITSGRKSIGEEWQFSRYYSLNDVWVDGKRIAKDVSLLEAQEPNSDPLPARTLGDRLAPYSCYATVIMYGPLAQSAIHHLAAEYANISVYKRSTPADLLWSFSSICDDKGCVVRVAAKETEAVRYWLGQSLKALEDVVGTEVYCKAFG